MALPEVCALLASLPLSFWAAAGILLLALVVYYRLHVVQPVVLHAREDGAIGGLVRDRMPILREHYWPTFWCFESRMQTVLASMTRRMIPDIRYQREV